MCECGSRITYFERFHSGAADGSFFSVWLPSPPALSSWPQNFLSLCPPAMARSRPALRCVSSTAIPHNHHERQCQNSSVCYTFWNQVPYTRNTECHTPRLPDWDEKWVQNVTFCNLQYWGGGFSPVHLHGEKNMFLLCNKVVAGEGSKIKAVLFRNTSLSEIRCFNPLTSLQLFYWWSHFSYNSLG